MSAQATAETNFFLRHEFLIRRVHSLLGIVPLGLYMTVHLATNASLLNGTQTFQRAVFLIHSPGKLLPLIEWGLIFTPLIFHAVIGVWIAKSGKSNSSQYKFRSNKRYTWQRWTGFIALVYLFFHILHLHGWFHIPAWEAIIRPLGFGVFRPFNAASSLVRAMQEWGYVWPAFYLVGMLACVYHLANGLWTSGITWGLWISPTAQARASKLCTVVGCGLAVLGVSAWWAAVSPSPRTTVEMEAIENRMYEAAVDSGMVTPNVEKRTETTEEGAEVVASEQSAAD
ncbi:MAG: succinate dehydrogenase [Planctomycetaceae bacterium]|nr:succinate dehydrogenase [Planctomycetaceae bacterium]